jgi:peptidoglycan hydrolase-like protein with peptidoglycan-binding domain
VVAWDSQDPASFGWARGSAADIVPFSWQAHLFPAGVARAAAPVFTRALDVLANAGYLMPPNRDPGISGTWGYEDRKISGSTRWSFHAYGLALDIAAPWNPQGYERPPASPHRLPVNTGELLRPLGIAWGGNWSGRADWMHIELHASPAEAQLLAGTGGSPTPAAAGQRPESTFPLPSGWYFGPWDGPRESVSGRGLTDGQWRPFLASAQRQLGITADGIYGPQTSNALRTWQAAHGLVVDGLLGPRTWASLGL